MLNIDCQIRGKADIHEALAAMTEVEIMEGSNQVFCETCKKNTDTVLRTAISELPNMLILSLKRFDLDFNTFETVKLNSKCAFGQTLNMKQYTLEGLEAMEQADETETSGETPMEISGSNGSAGKDPLSKIPDGDYEYKLAGVLVHAGVAQGGHYYSFIKDRSGLQEQWYRFDDEDVTPFDPASIEVECFGGKVKKETKWPNGQVHTVESEQFANALMLFYEKVKPTDPPEPEETNEKEEEEKQKINLNPEDFSSGYDVFEPDVRRSNATHRWQTFLFDAEFQFFLKGMLGLGRLPHSDQSDPGSLKPTESPHAAAENSWRSAVVEMLLNFVFDVLLYASERLYLSEWVSLIEEIFLMDPTTARAFVHKLAHKTREISPNWVRTYLIECPDQAAREAAVRIFGSAIQSCITVDDEQRALHNWTAAWKEELGSFGKGPPTPLPCALRGKWQYLEDISSGAEGSCIGCIISFLNILTEMLPRCPRYFPELSIFIRNIANVTVDPGGRVLRRAMLQAMVPARLMALVVREKASEPMTTAFPGASVALDIADSQIRTESSPVAHAMPLSGNHVMNPTDINHRGHAPAPSDFLPLFEAVGCLAALRGVVHAPLVVDSEETTRGRHKVALSKGAVNALTTIFQEVSAPGSGGMGHREIEMYLARCGIEPSNLPQQKIVDIMAKYPTPSGNGSKGGNSLSLEGFLAYYKDTAHTNETRVSSDNFCCFYYCCCIRCSSFNFAKLLLLVGS